MSRLTLSGGHPLEEYNLEACTNLCKRVRAEMPDIKIWCYTGYLWENVKDLEIMRYIDVLVDGPYIEELRDISIPWRGSSNQRVIDVTISLLTEVLTLYK
jgi:anaerobic ribonucleoside-triphosphate reductase activating protein